MDPAQLLREARRHAGYSQRQLASTSGVSLRTIAEVEKGRRNLSAHVLDGLLAACGLDLSLCLRPSMEAPPDVSEHLAQSTTQRLHRHCGGTGSDLTTGPQLWQELLDVAEHATFVLVDGVEAVGVWVPGLPVLERASVGVAVRALRRPLPASDRLEIRGVPERQGLTRVRGGVEVGLPRGGFAIVPPPAELLLDPRCGQHAELLRLAARCLHDQAGRDDAGRRAPAHRDPDELQEGVNLSRSLTYAMDSRRLPQPTDSRGWRVGAPVSLRQWHTENGHPPRRGSRRRE